MEFINDMSLQPMVIGVVVRLTEEDVIRIVRLFEPPFRRQEPRVADAPDPTDQWVVVSESRVPGRHSGSATPLEQAERESRGREHDCPHSQRPALPSETMRPTMASASAGRADLQPGAPPGRQSNWAPPVASKRRSRLQTRPRVPTAPPSAMGLS